MTAVADHKRAGPAMERIVRVIANNYDLDYPTERWRTPPDPAGAELTLNLSNLKRGSRAVITRIEADDPQITAKYAARGIIPGTSVGILGTGDPVLVGIDKQQWAINRFDAARIQVDLLEEPPRSVLSFLSGR
ncbi:MAG: FeoA family protein [Gammaproteobacteria bacterium]